VVFILFGVVVNGRFACVAFPLDSACTCGRRGFKFQVQISSSRFTGQLNINININITYTLGRTGGSVLFVFIRFRFALLVAIGAEQSREQSETHIMVYHFQALRAWRDLYVWWLLLLLFLLPLHAWCFCLVSCYVVVSVLDSEEVSGIESGSHYAGEVKKGGNGVLYQLAVMVLVVMVLVVMVLVVMVLVVMVLAVMVMAS
jgi:hypothetical protein